MQVGPQDLASLLARQSGNAEWREPLIASPFGTIHAATFSFPQPVGTRGSFRIRLASLGSDVTGLIDSRAVFESRDDAQMEFPLIDRARKGDRLLPSEHQAETPAALMSEPEPAPSSEPREDERAPAVKDTVASLSAVPAELSAGDDVARPFSFFRPDSVPLDEEPAMTQAEPATPDTEMGQAETESAEPDLATPTLDDDVSPTIRTARVYFGTEPMSGMTAAMQPWDPGQHPIFENALPISLPRDEIGLAPKPDPVSPEAMKQGETIAGKGQVTGEGRRPKSPAERLGLAGKTRAKAEKCLADAVYFEARGEKVRGQIAVAQVVMNRVFSRYYPDDVCGVVYQNAKRHLACQFTFACDGIPNRITEPKAWERAKKIARDTLDGKYWLDDVGKATHYHAYWVHPWWVREMRKLDKIGVHTFYRPRRWGDGSDMPVWGDAAATREATKKL